MTEVYLPVTGVARLIGIEPTTVRTHIARGKFPEPDVMIGDIRGWSEDTVLAWNEGRRGVAA